MLHQDVHIDKPLTNFAVAYNNLGYIAQDAVPFVPVNNKSDSYYVFTKKDKFTLPETIRGPKDKANQATWSSGSSSYAAIDHALRDFLPDAIVGNADQAVVPRQRTTNNLTDLLLLDYERRISALITTYANYAAAYRTQLSGGDRWDVATSDVLGAVETARAACFYPPNVCIMGEEVWLKVKHHAQILDRIKGGATADKPSLVRPELVAELFEVERLLIGKAKYNSSNKAQTESYSRVWGKNVVLAYVNPTVDLQNVSAWKAFRWRQLATDAAYKVRSYRDEEIGGGGEWIEVEQSYDEKSVCSDVAYLIDTVIS